MGHARFSRPQLARGEGRQWKTVKKDGNVHFIRKKVEGLPADALMHTHTKTKVYARLRDEANEVKEIAIMNPKTGKKIMAIHTDDHKGLGPHVHHWNPGKHPKGKPVALTKSQQKYLDKINTSLKNPEK